MKKYVYENGELKEIIYIKEVSREHRTISGLGIVFLGLGSYLGIKRVKEIIFHAKLWEKEHLN